MVAAAVPVGGPLHERAAAGAQMILDLIESIDTKLDVVRRDWLSLRSGAEELRSVAEQEGPSDD